MASQSTLPDKWQTSVGLTVDETEIRAHEMERARGMFRRRREKQIYHQPPLSGELPRTDDSLKYNMHRAITTKLVGWIKDNAVINMAS